tara:strand:+ start:1179 stop:1790 length:612 start_codon:yes stop_codon:yes gene_type:complete
MKKRIKYLQENRVKPVRPPAGGANPKPGASGAPGPGKNPTAGKKPDAPVVPIAPAPSTKPGAKGGPGGGGVAPGVAAGTMAAGGDGCCPEPQKIVGMPELLKLVSACLEALEAQLLQGKQLDGSIDMVGAAVAGVTPAELEARMATFGKGASVPSASANQARPASSKRASRGEKKSKSRQDEQQRRIEKMVKEELANLMETRN